MKNGSTRSLVILSSSLLLILFPIILSAQDISDESPETDTKIIAAGDEIDFYALEESLNVQVEVASLFREEELVVGSTVSRITPAQWKTRGARRLTDALENEASVVNYTALGGFNTTAIRGYTRDAIVTKGVVTLIDSIPIISYNNGTNDGMPNLGLGALNGIELIKGPGSAIYGSDAFHGVISLNTFASGEDVYSAEAACAYPLYADGDLKISQGIGRIFRLNAAAAYSGQLQSEDLEYEYNTAERDSLFSGLLPPEPAAEGKGACENRYNTATGIIKLAARPTDKFTIDIGGYIVYNRFEDFSGLKEAGFTQLNDRDLSGQKSTLYIGRAAVSYEFDTDISVEAKGYYWYWDMCFDFFTHSDGRNFLLYVDEQRAGTDFIIKQPENFLNLQWLAGYSFYNLENIKGVTYAYDVNGNPYSEPSGIIVEKNPAAWEGKERTVHSVFVQSKWGAINKLLYVLIGGRVDGYSDCGTQFTPRGGFIITPYENFAAKALYGRAFMAPSGSALYGVLPFASGDKDIKPETIDIYELIFICKEKKWKTSLNLFYSLWKNGIILEADPDAVGGSLFQKYTNSGKNRAYGGEYSVYYPFDPFAAEIGLSYVKSEALSVTSDPRDATSRKVDREYGTFPEYTVICGLYYRLKSLDINFFLNNRLYLNMLQSASPDETEKLPPYWRMDLNISKKITERFEMFIDIKNITNRENKKPSLYYPIIGYISDDPSQDNTGVKPGIPEAGISILIRAGYKL